MQMKKLLLSLIFVTIVNVVFAQFNYIPNGRNDAPTLGPQFGIVGGGFTAMLNNRDDIDADQRLDPQLMNFSFGGGVEYIYWFQNTVGFGAQLNYWVAGAAYKGVDTLYPQYNLSLDAKSKLTYAKLPLLFHFKSYNRYYPNRRLRFSAAFGPYASFLLNYSDDVRFFNDSAKFESNVNFSQKELEASTNLSTVKTKGKISSELYNKFDLGFIFAVGGEMRLWRNTVVALHIRTDVGISNVENTRSMKIKYADASGNYPANTPEVDFKYWDGYYSKFNEPTAIDKLAGWQSNRPATKNFSVGAFISLRKYF
jgi:hypothetical protein